MDAANRVGGARAIHRSPTIDGVSYVIAAGRRAGRSNVLVTKAHGGRRRNRDGGLVGLGAVAVAFPASRVVHRR